MSNPTTAVRPGRFSATIDGDFVVFLIGMRVNKPWKLLTTVRIARAMSAMQKELRSTPELGCLHIENWNGRTTLSLQYWRSVEHLHAYARGDIHLPAWREFNRRVRDSGDAGIWHETYQVKAGQYETVYSGMPPLGLGRAGKLVPASGSRESARQRIERSS